MRARRCILLLGLSLLAQAVAGAQSTYRILPIVKAGDTIGDVKLRANSSFFGAALNDDGHLAFGAQDQAGGLATILYADGMHLPLAVTGSVAPGGGIWSRGLTAVGIYYLSINQSGSLVFPARVQVNKRDMFRTFLWDHQAQKLKVLTLPGMPAASTLTLEEGYMGAINNKGEIALHALARDAARKTLFGVFLRDAEGRFQAVALPGQSLPDGRTVSVAWVPSLNDAGVVAFAALRQGDRTPPGTPHSADAPYLWESGVISAPVPLGAEVAGGRKIAQSWYALLNNKNRNLLLQVILDTPFKGPHALCLAAEGTSLAPVAVPGQEMPGGGQLISAVPGVSPANERGQHAFVAQITEAGSTHTALYLMEPDGKLSLILKSGTTTELGPISRIGPRLSPFGVDTPSSVALNSKGQIAVPLQIGGLLEVMALLTPRGP